MIGFIIGSTDVLINYFHAACINIAFIFIFALIFSFFLKRKFCNEKDTSVSDWFYIIVILNLPSFISCFILSILLFIGWIYA